MYIKVSDIGTSRYNEMKYEVASDVISKCYTTSTNDYYVE